MDIELGIQNVARTVTFSTEQSADEVNNVIAEAVENGKTINLTDDKGRRLRQSLIATCTRVGHVPYEKDVGPYQVRRLFHIRFMYPVHAWKFHIRISCGM